MTTCKLTNHFSNHEEKCNKTGGDKLDLGFACRVIYHLHVTFTAHRLIEGRTVRVDYK